MTDTPDAAKLLRDDLTKLLAHIEDGPYIGAKGVADAVLNWVRENIPNLSLQLARGNLQNTRPQPAPPEGEPVLLDPVRRTAISGLAARPKVEDAREASIDRELALVRQRALAEAVHRYEFAEAKLAEREAELAKAVFRAGVAEALLQKADAVIYARAQRSDKCVGLIDYDLDAALKRHAARQQQKSGIRSQ